MTANKLRKLTQNTYTECNLVNKYIPLVYTLCRYIVQSYYPIPINSKEGEKYAWCMLTVYHIVISMEPWEILGVHFSSKCSDGHPHRETGKSRAAN